MSAKVLDASALVSLSGSLEARSSIASLIVDDTLHSLDLALVECANALWKYACFAALLVEDADALLDTIERLDVEYHETAPLLPAVLRLAIELRHPVYDCAYIALAMAENAGLVTCDRRLAEAARRAGLADRVVVIEAG
ncbi:MAG TPA: type II toxin-antitoxin system VapC family toxin [Coriobacteriia bacterium]